MSDRLSRLERLVEPAPSDEQRAAELAARERWARLCGRVGELSRAACRAEAERRFSVAAMADGYEAVYRRVLRPAAIDRTLRPA